jgi:glutamine synthetase
MAVRLSASSLLGLGKSNNNRQVKLLPFKTASMRALEQDHEFLLLGDVFTTQMIERWIRYKREKEIDLIRSI